MTAQDKAQILFRDHYMLIFDAGGEMSEECLISILATAHAKLTATEIADEEFRNKVLTELDKL